jgi:TPR repeat protein
MYRDGRGVEKNGREAVAWFRKAADQGYALAQRYLADQGIAPAQRDLGAMYMDGRGVEKNEREAVAWFRKAADQGYAPAQCKVGYSYAVGRGLDESGTTTPDPHHQPLPTRRRGAQSSRPCIGSTFGRWT